MRKAAKIAAREPGTQRACGLGMHGLRQRCWVWSVSMCQTNGEGGRGGEGDGGESGEADASEGGGGGEIS
jgi:hypothetical protein